MESQQHPQQQMQQRQQPNEDCRSSSNSKSSFLCRQSTRWTPTTDQIRILKDLYYNYGVRSPNAEQIQRISARLRQYGKIEGKNVFYWFQNHKARERQKKRFTVDMTMHKDIGGGGWKPEDSIHNAYTNMSHGASSSSSLPSSLDVFAVGLTGNTGYGSILMEKSFKNCSISAGGSISNNLEWFGVDPCSSPYTNSDKRKSIGAFEETSEREEDQEIATLPLFPLHGEHVANVP